MEAAPVPWKVWVKVAHATDSHTSRLNPSAVSLGRKRVFLLCPEVLRPMACCAEDALTVRGWDVSLEIGSAARRWVRHAPPGPPAVRVLCVPAIEPALAERLRRGLDPMRAADFHILSFDTPHGIVQEIERLAGHRQPRRRRPLESRPYLVQPTMLEEQAHVDRGWRVGALAMVAAAILGSFTGAALHTVEAGDTAAPAVAQRVDLDTMGVARAPVDAPISAPVTSRLIDDGALSAVAPARRRGGAVGWADDERRVHYRYEDALEEDEEIIVILADEEPPKGMRRTRGAEATVEPITAISSPLARKDSAPLGDESEVLPPAPLESEALAITAEEVDKAVVLTAVMPAGISLPAGMEKITAAKPRRVTYDPMVTVDGGASITAAAAAEPEGPKTYDPFVTPEELKVTVAPESPVVEPGTSVDPTKS